MAAITDVIRTDGFSPAPTDNDRAERSLFVAVRKAHGMGPIDADVCFWNWEHLRAHLTSVWHALDQAATVSTGRPIQAHVWALDPERTFEEVLQLVASADDETVPPHLVTAERRPVIPGLSGADKPRGALITALAVIGSGTSSTMPVTIAEALEAIPLGANNEASLRALDAMAAPVRGPRIRPEAVEVAKLLSRHYASRLRFDNAADRPWSFREFLQQVSDANPRAVSDEALVAWLRGRFPDSPPKPRRTQLQPIARPRPDHQHRPVAGRTTIGASRSFVAIDVETANRDRASICAVAAVVVDDGVITRSERWLCRPPEGLGHFEPINIGIHGIRARDVETAPSFSEVATLLTELLKSYPVVAHNASFDVAALLRASRASGVDLPEFDYSCTMALARAGLDLPSYRLDHCCKRFDIPLKHHDPLSDASGSARLLLELLTYRGVETIDELMLASRVRWGRASQLGGLGVRLAVSETSRRDRPPTADVDAPPDHPLFGMYVAFTGDLISVTRAEAFEMLAAVGAQGQTSVNGLTNMLVAGMQNPAMLAPGASMSGKMKKAFELQAQGQAIEVIEAFDFFALLDGD